MIETVLGPIRPDELGAVSTNEHVLTDSRHLQRAARDGSRLDGPLTIDMLGDLRWNWLGSSDNLTLDDRDLAAAELARAGAVGLTGIVEATSWGMGPRHADLPDVAKSAGIHIISAYGSYIDKTLPEWWRDQTESEMEHAFRVALTQGVPGTNFRAGALGLLGTSATPLEPEQRALRAAARVAVETGCAISIRLDAAARRAGEIIDTLTAEGVAADKVLLCNMDKVLDLSYILSAVDRGAVIEFAFGSESNFADRARDATDVERLDALVAILDRRPDAAVTLSCSVWTKGQLARYGGMGYSHVVQRVAPTLERLGVSRDRVHTMLVDRPALLLDRKDNNDDK
ncbi:phosphotriesterase-related protein [Microbacterium endophyticum]|uniref:Phosphotriesterase-related protein n=1 Tax=Microbacterium endophyticum TaxID=1526412 RepID=A0A7W4V1Z3_9MICO|nr:phosphotriesterase [Microbacterium endophyticum]MBB2975357.1 phosphotriesterase-related protein [Microbacterium endophyticum]NIK35624.1 phosphotriesterase-related protein [Microbacterium endophyticum]